MSFSASLPNYLRPRREKIFGMPKGYGLDRNAKVRIKVYAEAWSAKHRQPGQHRGPLTRAFIEVLQALLWGFHNSKSGLCFPSYEAIAEKARCSRDTVYEAIKALERATVLSWVNRLVREQVRERDLFGQLVTRWRIVRTSNAYLFRDPLPCASGRADAAEVSKSENPPGTLNQDLSLEKPPISKNAGDLSDMPESLLKALYRLGKAIEARDGGQKA